MTQNTTLKHKHENLTELHTLMAAPLTVTSLTKSERQGFEYPVSGDALAIIRAMRDPLAAARKINHRGQYRIRHNV